MDSKNAIYSEVPEDVTKSFTISNNSCYGQVTSGNAADVLKVSNSCYGLATKSADRVSNACHKIALVILYIFVIAFLLALVGACVAFTMEISSVKSEKASSQTASSLQVVQDALVRRMENVENLMQQFTEMTLQSKVGYLQLNDTVQQLSAQLNYSLPALVRRIENVEDLIQQCRETLLELETAVEIQSNESYSAYLLLNHTIQELSLELSQGFSTIGGNIELLNISIESIDSSLGSANFPVPSCTALSPSSPSGYYWVTGSNGFAAQVYCDMTRSCGGVTGGWMRVAELDMTNSNQHCPNGLRQRTDSNIRTCEITSGAKCSSVIFNLQSLVMYSRICGMIQGYQVGSTDSFGNSGRGINPTIEQNYVDGISLTHGHPRQHIWTFAAAPDEVGTIPHHNCPCISTNLASRAIQPPSYVGDDYFCDTASVDRYIINHFYSDDPLWDGAGCGPLNTCCSFNSPPWFYKQLPEHTTDGVEMRMCRDQLGTDENIAIERVEIYVQ